MKGALPRDLFLILGPLHRLSQHMTERTEAMHNMKKLILSVFIFTFGFATATHAQQVNMLLTKQLSPLTALVLEAAECRIFCVPRLSSPVKRDYRNVADCRGQRNARFDLQPRRGRSYSFASHSKEARRAPGTFNLARHRPIRRETYRRTLNERTVV